MSKLDYYEILGVSKSATAEEIKQAYRKKAKEHHPDKTGGDDSMFKQVSEAYEVLSDTNKRNGYDNPNTFGDSFGGFSGFDPFDNFSNIFFGAGNRNQTPAKQRGSNLRVSLKITIENMIHGDERTITYTRNVVCGSCSGKGGEKVVTCTTCNGSGKKVDVRQNGFGYQQTIITCPTCSGRGKTVVNPCSKCKGGGIEQRKENYTIGIPAGVVGGMSFTIKGMGNYSSDGIAGDLIVQFEDVPHVTFKKHNQDIEMSLYLDYPDLLLGGEFDINTPRGVKRIKIEENTALDKVFMYHQEGIPMLGGNGAIINIGNLYINLKLNAVKELSNKQKELLLKFKKTLS